MAGMEMLDIGTNLLRILVVEDDALIGMLLTEMLRDMGHVVCGVSATEDEAVADAASCKPDLMIVDARLGFGSGVAAVNEILRAGYVPHVMISGAKIEPDSAGTVTLQKPFRERELCVAIARAMDPRRAF